MRTVKDRVYGHAVVRIAGVAMVLISCCRRSARVAIGTRRYTSPENVLDVSETLDVGRESAVDGGQCWIHLGTSLNEGVRQRTTAKPDSCCELP